MATPLEPVPVIIGGYAWYPVIGTTNERTYSYEHIAICGGDPRRVQGTATTVGYGPRAERPKEVKNDTLAANRLRFVLFTKYGIRGRRR